MGEKSSPLGEEFSFDAFSGVGFRVSGFGYQRGDLTEHRTLKPTQPWVLLVPNSEATVFRRSEASLLYPLTFTLEPGTDQFKMK